MSLIIKNVDHGIPKTYFYKITYISTQNFSYAMEIITKNRSLRFDSHQKDINSLETYPHNCLLCKYSDKAVLTLMYYQLNVES